MLLRMNFDGVNNRLNHSFNACNSGQQLQAMNGFAFGLQGPILA
jgi:hypothetical protein